MPTGKPAAIGDDTNGAVISLLPPSVIQLEIHGDIPAAMAPPIAKAIESYLGPLAEAWLVVDLERMTRYHPSLRTLCTQVLWKQRKKVRGVHALATSKLTRMGVAVANLALGGIITAHGERAPFAAALEDLKRQMARAEARR